MSEEPKRWKRGDIGPDGRVFWTYRKDMKDGVWWIKPEDWVKRNAVSRGGYGKNPRYLRRLEEIEKQSVEGRFSHALGILMSLPTNDGQSQAEALQMVSGWPLEFCKLIAPEIPADDLF